MVTRVRAAFSGMVACAVAAAGVFVAVTGCELNRTADHELSAVLEHYQRGAGDEAGRYARAERASSAASQPHTTRPASQPANVVKTPQSLREYILVALRDNPDIKAAEETARAAAARVPQVTALPDPMLETKTLPTPVRTADGDNFFNLGVTLTLPVPAKLDRAGRVALQEARMALEELRRTRLQVIADVKRAYFRLYIIDMTVATDSANQDLLRGLIDVARAQVASGRRAQEDVLRAEVEFATLAAQLIEFRQQRTSVVALLNQLLNRRPLTPVPTPEPFDTRAVDARVEELFALAVEVSPVVRRLKEQLERERQAVQLARLAYWPDFTVGFEWMAMNPRAAFQPPRDPLTGMRPDVDRMSERGMDGWAITVALNLPIWFEKIEAGIREAHSRLRATEYEYVAAQNRVRFQVEDAYARVRAQQELAALFKHTIIPEAQQAYEVSREAYRGGTTNFLYVIDNWQKWLSFDIQYHTALGELERSVADLEEALGQSLAAADSGT